MVSSWGDLVFLRLALSAYASRKSLLEGDVHATLPLCPEAEPISSVLLLLAEMHEPANESFSEPARDRRVLVL